MTVTVKRTQKSEYKLMVDGSVVKTYNQTKMTHPHEWRRDAENAGASQTDIWKYEYIDAR